MEKGEVLIKAEGVGKKFSRSLKLGLWYGFTDILRGILGIKSSMRLRKDEFWAVSNMNFDVRRGECLGLIGHNGAGKSTLLKMLNGLIRPDTGRIEMHGRVGALIELGTGFNPLLTGRENVYVNGTVLGLTKEEIDQKFEAIIEFAEIGEFIDMPVQNYSSGMKVRLGFAVAAQVEPDILIVDEVLAVGDLGFVLKCFNTIDRLLENTAVILVSHSMPMISRMCSKIVLMEKGEAAFQGVDVSKGIDLYYGKFDSKMTSFKRSTHEVELLEITMHCETKKELPMINHGDDLKISFRLKILKEFENAAIGFTLFDKEQKPVGLLFSENKVPAENITVVDQNYIEIKATLKAPRINLSKGVYSLTFFVSESVSTKPLARLNSVLFFQVISKRDIWPPIEFECFWV